MIRRLIVASSIVACVVACSRSASADLIFDGSSGSLAARVDFSLSGTQLTVTLTNTSANAVGSPSDVLTAVFFSAGANLTPVSATLPTGGVIWDWNGTAWVNANGTMGTNLGGEWGYATGLSGAPGGADSGISSSGLNWFGVGTFNGPNLAGPGNGALDGLQFGLVPGKPGNIQSLEGNNQHPLVANAVTFVLTTPTGFSLDDLSKVSFQYGTSASEPNYPGFPEITPHVVTPEPAGLTLASIAVALSLGTTVRRRRVGLQSNG